jgi:hypothetical protein
MQITARIGDGQPTKATIVQLSRPYTRPANGASRNNRGQSKGPKGFKCERVQRVQRVQSRLAHSVKGELIVPDFEICIDPFPTIQIRSTSVIAVKTRPRFGLCAPFCMSAPSSAIFCWNTMVHGKCPCRSQSLYHGLDSGITRDQREPARSNQETAASASDLFRLPI